MKMLPSVLLWCDCDAETAMFMIIPRIQADRPEKLSRKHIILTPLNPTFM